MFKAFSGDGHMEARTSPVVKTLQAGPKKIKYCNPENRKLKTENLL